MTQDEAKMKLVAHCGIWAGRGIREVVCNYSGSGDEGFIQGYEVDGVDQSSLDYADTMMRDAFDALIFAEVSGDGEGGGGQIIVNVVDRKIYRREYYNETVETYIHKTPQKL